MPDQTDQLLAVRTATAMPMISAYKSSTPFVGCWPKLRSTGPWRRWTAATWRRAPPARAMKSLRTTVIQAAPIALRRDQASQALGISVSLFESLVRRGRMPKPPSPRGQECRLALRRVAALCRGACSQRVATGTRPSNESSGNASRIHFSPRGSRSSTSTNWLSQLRRSAS